MTTIATVNVNGIRAAVRQRSETNLGFLAWLEQTPAEVICLQEVRASPEQAEAALRPALDQGWHWYLAHSEIKGRAGVGILSRQPGKFTIGLPHASEFESSGRYIEAVFHNLTVASVYIPAGEAGTEKQREKERFTALLLEYMRSVSGHMLLCGDWNIAHTEYDIKNAKGNVKNSGFLPEERAWFDEVLTPPWVDVVRSHNPGEHGPYSWWSQRGKAFDNNTGWRIDYHIATAQLAACATSSWVDRAPSYAARWSDHAPVVVHYDSEALVGF